MFLTEFFGLFSLSAYMMWGFLMAFFFNVFIYSLNIKRNTTLLLSSFIMMVSYTTSDYFYTWLSIQNGFLLDWAFYDIGTIAVLLCTYFFIQKTTPSFLYLIMGLTINSLFFISMYIDLYIFNNQEPWIFWDIYTFSVNLIDLIMIVVLIVDRDFLGLHKLKRKLLSPFKNIKQKRIL
jgi:heme O synthase-like polyprenyltransferase